jgi:Tfp pilus assembly PilM family ATPase
MAKLITCEWDPRSVRLLVSSVQGKNLAIDKMVEIAIEQESDSTSSHTALETALATAAQAAGIRGQADVVFVLRRAQTEMRLLTLPNIPADELPDTVRFQVAQQFNTADEGPVDFVVLGETDDNQIFVSVATVAPQVLSDVMATSSMAGLTSKSVVLSSFSTANFIHSQTPTSQHRLIVDLLDGELELTVCHNGLAQFARSVKLPERGASPLGVLSEVRRTIASYSNQPTPGHVELVTIIGNSQLHQEIQNEISEKLSIDAELYNPLDDCIVTSLDNSNTDSTPNEPAQFTSLIGAAFQLQIGEIPTLDFVNPRKPPVPISPLRKNLKYILSGLVAFVLAAVFLIKPVITTKETISQLQIAVQDKPSKDKTNKALTTRLQKVASFENSRINWLDELVSMSNKFPPAKQALVDSFTAKTSISSRNAETRGQIYVDVHLLNVESLQMLETNLLTPAYRITGTGFQPDPENSDYPFTVTERIRIITPDPETNAIENKSEASGASPELNIENKVDQANSQLLQTTNASVQLSVEELCYV